MKDSKKPSRWATLDAAAAELRKLRKQAVEQRCDPYDHALVQAASTQLEKGNAVICVCVHCRQQGKTSITHTRDCCFSSNKTTHYNYD
jgi:hypothetical protein